jgi:RES domain-containing protein
VKIAALGPGEAFYRYLTPKWAYVPLSGAGAAGDGGRFNRVGIEALYLARTPQTALEEYRQNSSLVPPATLVGYLVSLDGVVDLSDGYDPAIWTSDWADWDCPWRRIARIDNKVPPSWSMADTVISQGYKGILFPSVRHPGGTNLVIFNSNLMPADQVSVHDPDGRLPKDQSSWPA